jgi:hypothetical protein
MDEHFQRLGLTRNATLTDLKRAYRRLAKEWHPDACEHDPVKKRISNEQMREINAAYETLKSHLEKGEGSEDDSPTDSTKTSYEQHSEGAKDSTQSREDFSGGFDERSHSSKPTNSKDDPYRVFVDFAASKIPVAWFTWYSEPKYYAWALPLLAAATTLAIILVIEIARGIASITVSLIWLVQEYAVPAVLIASPVATVVTIFWWNIRKVRRKHHAQAVARMCPKCGFLSAIHYEGDDILSKSEQVRTVIQTTYTNGYWGGQRVSLASTAPVQVIVEVIVFRKAYRCTFCRHVVFSSQTYTTEHQL